jgi:hypothetical protein
MPKGLPEHREIIAIRAQPNDTLDTDPVGIAAPKTVRDSQGSALALARTAQKPLIPAAGCQLIPDEGGNAARVANRQPSWSLAASHALPLAGLARAGELTPIYVPAPADEAMRDLVRTPFAHGY